MLDPNSVPEVNERETLSRYILSHRHINRQSRLLKADVFVPHPHTELSVTRGREVDEKELWQVGRAVAALREKPLLGRGDAVAASYLAQSLSVLAAPIKGNPNHANVTDWPRDDKKAQKLIAQKIAAVAIFLEAPDS